MAIETALVAPVLAVLSIGTFEVGTMVSRQQELQSGASEAEGIILAAAASGGAPREDIEVIIEKSLDLDEEQVELTQRFRCSNEDELILDGTTCATTPIYRYVRLEIRDNYSPVWTNFGVGRPINYNIVRTVLVR